MAKDKTETTEEEPKICDGQTVMYFNEDSGYVEARCKHRFEEDGSWCEFRNERVVDPDNFDEPIDPDDWYITSKLMELHHGRHMKKRSDSKFVRGL